MRRLFTVPAIVLAMVTGLSAVAASPALAATTDVGVIPSSHSCPIGAEAITIHMDDEDDDNTNSTSGFIGAINNVHNTDLFFCRVDGTAMHAVNVNGAARPYAVLKLGANCPNGSVEFSRYLDNEDNDNTNSVAGNIFPNVVNNNTTLRFCLFAPQLPATAEFANFGFGYLVFSAVDSSGSFYTDDEDDDNTNSYSAPLNVESIAKSIVSDGPNTNFRVRIAR